ncbi:PREDICTED: uncharacterized protein LOC109184725 [Ipomoea nil]|uniref:uncharacterized protein LOC109184725 n=1 Tax=Ipomoea nil TaxID=35883 RepID=UPI000901A472|nr:PREDICTED: uncharacterized protein LOC109184725 [Ipomoea nil]
MDTFTTGSTHFQQVFIWDKWYPFGPAEMNEHLGRPTQQKVPDPSLHLLAAALTHNWEVSWPSTGLKSLKLTTVYFVLLRLASANWIPAVCPYFISDQLVLFLYKIRNRKPFNLGEMIISHIMSFVKKNEAKIHLPYPNLIFGVLKLQGFKPYKDETMIQHDNTYIFDDWLTQNQHYDDRATLSALPASPAPTPPVSAPGSSSDTTSAPVSESGAMPKEPPTLLARRKIVATVQESIAQLQCSIASQQATISELEKILGAQLQEITRLENIHARILVDNRDVATDTRTYEDEDDSVSGTPSAR